MKIINILLILMCTNSLLANDNYFSKYYSSLLTNHFTINLLNKSKNSLQKKQNINISVSSNGIITAFDFQKNKLVSTIPLSKIKDRDPPWSYTYFIKDYNDYKIIATSHRFMHYCCPQESGASEAHFFIVGLLTKKIIPCNGKILSTQDPLGCSEPEGVDGGSGAFDIFFTRKPGFLIGHVVDQPDFIYDYYLNIGAEFNFNSKFNSDSIIKTNMDNQFNDITKYNLTNNSWDFESYFFWCNKKGFNPSQQCKKLENIFKAQLSYKQYILLLEKYGDLIDEDILWTAESLYYSNRFLDCFEYSQSFITPWSESIKINATVNNFVLFVWMIKSLQSLKKSYEANILLFQIQTKFNLEISKDNNLSKLIPSKIYYFLRK